MKCKPYYILIVAVLLFGCKHKLRAKLEWSSINIDTGIAKSPVYKMLDKQKDIFTPFESSTDTLRRKTSNVSYRNNRDRNINDTTYARLNNCRSYFKNDTLKINIGRSSGFAWDGFIINCYNKQFNILPYHGFDGMIFDDSQEPTTFKVLNQSITLDRHAYRLGDSVYGKVNFKIIETTAGQKITHVGYGYFRAKVEKR
jgi:hypothetical protein